MGFLFVAATKSMFLVSSWNVNVMKFSFGEISKERVYEIGMKYIDWNERHTINKCSTFKFLNSTHHLCCKNSFLSLFSFCSQSLDFAFSSKNSEKFWFSMCVVVFFFLDGDAYTQHNNHLRWEKCHLTKTMKRDRAMEKSEWEKKSEETISSRRHFWHLFVYLCTYVQFSFSLRSLL